MSDTVGELTLEDLADPVETDVDWSHAASVLDGRKYIGNHHIEAVFESLGRSDEQDASYEDLYAKIEQDYEITSDQFRFSIRALSQAGIVPRHNSGKSDADYLYAAGEYSADKWRKIEGKTYRAIDGDLG